MAIDYKLIGNRIKEKRKECGKRQIDVAADIYVSSGYISQIERGLTKTNLETLSDIADILNCDVADFITGSNSPGRDKYKEDILNLYHKLSIEERLMLYSLLKAYIASK